MICLQKENNIRTSGVALTKEMSIKKEGMGFIQNILRSQIYSDKISAVLREVCVNGIDSHAEAGRSDRAIQVTLPSRFNTTLKIRDFGVGMSEATILDIYSFYGSSTKRDTNLQSGFMGIGKVSPLSYGDSFVVASFFNGIKNTYNVYVDTNNLSQIAKLNSEVTDEETGVEVSLSVKDSDIQAFEDKAKVIFGHFKVPPIVNGVVFSKIDKEPIIKGKDWAIYNSDCVAVAIMGNVAYPISDQFRDSKISDLLNCGIEIEFEIGSISVSASRESLEYNDSSKKAIAAKLNLILVELLTELNIKFNSCKSLFDAKKLYRCMEYGGRLSPLMKLVKHGISFGGVKIQSSSMDTRDMGFTDKQLSVTRYYINKWNSRKTVNKGDVIHIECGDDVIIVDNDSNCLRSKIYDFLISGKRVYVINFSDNTQKALFLKKTGLGSPTFVKLSTLTKTTSVKPGSNAPTISNVKHSTKVFAYELAKSNFSTKRSDFWKVDSADLKKDSGVYLEIDQFCYRDKTGWHSPINLNSIVQMLKPLGVSIPKVYGFKKGCMGAVKKNFKMVCLWEFIDIAINQFLKKENLLQKAANYLEYYEHCGHPSVIDASMYMVRLSQIHTSSASKKTVFSKNRDIIHYMKNDKNEKLLKLAQENKQYFTLAEKPEHDLKKLKYELSNTYPLLGYLRIGDTLDKTNHVAVIKYINLIDG